VCTRGSNRALLGGRSTSPLAGTTLSGMPSIEIAVIGLDTPQAPPSLSFSVAYEPGLKSHRVPSRFQADFDRLSGSLYHLGNPGLPAEGGAFFASDLLSLESRNAHPPSFLEFARPHVASVHALLEWLLRNSRDGNLLFTSDWQFGPTGTQRLAPVSLKSFWSLHDSRGLVLNAAYPVSGAV
jgi:hypothetical protein